MLRPTQLNTPSPLVGVDEIVAPPGPVRVSNFTETLLALAFAASSTRLKLTTSLRALDSLTDCPSHARLSTVPVKFSTCREARSSSRATLSPPSFAQIALMLDCCVPAAVDVGVGVV